jgi:hypothetical protein
VCVIGNNCYCVFVVVVDGDGGGVNAFLHLL